MIELKTEIIYADEFEEDTKLNIHELGKEIFIQPNMLEKYSRYVTNIAYEKNLLKIKLNHRKNELYLEIREKPEEYGIAYKLTEKTIEALVELDSEVEQMTEDLYYVMKVLGEAEGALHGVTDKGFALKSAVDLYKTGYWGELSSIPEKMQQVIDEYYNRENMKESLETDARMLKRAKKREI